MKFYGSVDRYTAFHASQGCGHLSRASTTVVELGRYELSSRQPCAVCFPDFPRLKVLHRLCTRCGHSKVTPCPHNGGVQVMIDGLGGERRRWVWPEQAYRYQLAPSAIRV